MSDKGLRLSNFGCDFFHLNTGNGAFTLTRSQNDHLMLCFLCCMKNVIPANFSFTLFET